MPLLLPLLVSLFGCTEPPILDPVEEELANRVIATAEPQIRLFVGIAGVIAETCTVYRMSGYPFQGEAAAALRVTSANVTESTAGDKTWSFEDVGVDGTDGNLVLSTDSDRLTFEVTYTASNDTLISGEFHVLGCEPTVATTTSRAADDTGDTGGGDTGGGTEGVEVCDGVDNDGDTLIDEDLADSDRDGLCDGLDEETCDGEDNDGDGAADEGMPDMDSDGLCDDLDIPASEYTVNVSGNISVQSDSETDHMSIDGDKPYSSLTFTPATAVAPTGGWIQWANAEQTAEVTEEIILEGAANIDYTTRTWPGKASGARWARTVSIGLP